MPFGDILAKGKEKLTLVSADGKVTVIDSNLKRLFLRIFGMPHIGMQMRARPVFKNLNINKGMRLLDAGCGDGFYASTISNKNRVSAVGADIDKTKINNARKIAESGGIKNVKFEVLDLRKLKFKKETFDKIICSDVLEHIKEDGKVINELSRVLKKGGEILFTIPLFNNHNIMTMEEYGHVRPGYTVKSFRNKIKNLSLKMVKVSYYDYLFGQTAWFFNRLSLKVAPLAALFFYPLNLLSYLDFLRIGIPNGIFIKVVKE